MARDIGEWFEALRLSRYADAFADNEIDLPTLPHITEEDLKEIGVALGARRKMLGAIAELVDSDDPATTDERSDERPASAEAERRQLTVMFCDLVGSTALSERLDPEDLRRVIGAFQESCAKVISRFDGFVARYMGDGLLVYFGYPQAHEDDAERAVRAGLGIVESVRSLDGELQVTPQVRIGVATGLVVAGDIIGEGASEERAVLGETPNLAARLQGLAEPDMVVISQATRRLVEGLFDYQDLDAQRLKGISDPVSAYRVTGESAAHSRFEATAIKGLTRLVGREEEIGLLLKRWRQAVEGEGQVLVLTGEAGVGKSRILRTFRERVDNEIHNRILYYCSPYHQNSALYPAINQLERAARFEKADGPEHKFDKLEAVLRGLDIPVAEIAPVLATMLSLPVNDRYPPLDMSPQQLRNRILDASVAVIEAMAAQNPVLLVLEDAHWIDPTSLDMLSMAVDRSRSARIFLVITARPEFVHPWAGQAHLTALALNRLGRRECTEMIDRVTEGKALPGEVVDHIVAKTDGVPLFVEELTKTVVESGLLEEADDRYLLNGPLPPLAIPVSLQDSLMARLDRQALVKEVAQLAAVIGRTFGHDLLAAISPLGENELTDAVTQLVEAGLVYSRGLPPEAIYEFKHALVQDAAYESLLISTRQEYHQTIARTLEERFPHLVEAEPELLAHHYTEAGLNEEAVPYWQDAGERAAQTSANVEAIQHLTKGLALVERLAEGPDRDARELDLWMTLIAPLATARGYSAPEMERAFTRALALCQQLGDTARIFPILYGRWAYHYAGGQVTRCRELAVDFLELAEGQQDPIPRLAGQRILGTASMMNGDPVAARQHLEEALAGFDPEAHGSLSQSYVQDLGVSILSYSALTLSFLGYPDRAAARAREALARARAADHLNTLLYTLFHVGLFLPWLMRDAETLESNVEQVIAISSEHAIPMWLGAGKIFRGAIVRQAGGLEAALAESDEGSEMLQAIQFELLRGLSCLLRAKNLAELGRVDDAAQWLDDGLSVAEASGEHWIEAEFHRVRGDLNRDSENRGEAEACFNAAIEVARGQGAKLWELRAATSLARLWHEQGKTGEARGLLAPIHGWFTEGFDTPDLKDAKALLDELVFRLIQEVPAFTCLRASRARSTFLQMSWAVAVQLKGLEVSLCLAR